MHVKEEFTNHTPLQDRKQYARCVLYVMHSGQVYQDLNQRSKDLSASVIYSIRAGSPSQYC